MGEWGLYKGSDVRAFNSKNKAVYDIIYKIIDERRKTKVTEDATDLLSLLMFYDHECTFTRTELAENMYTLFTATMNAPCVVEWCIALAAKHRDMEKRLRDELEAVVGDKDKIGPKGMVPDQLDKLVYMKMFVQESLRFLCPVTNPITKTCTKDFTLPGSKTFVPAG